MPAFAGMTDAQILRGAEELSAIVSEGAQFFVLSTSRSDCSQGIIARRRAPTSSIW
jgi:hypothetical protein